MKAVQYSPIREEDRRDFAVDSTEKITALDILARDS